MEPNILDLRQERCPMALLLAKRHTKALDVGQKTWILVADSSSLKDIELYLRKQSFELSCVKKDGYHRIQVIR